MELHVLKGEHFHTIIFDEMGKAIGKLNVKKYWIFPKITRSRILKLINVNAKKKKKKKVSLMY